MENGSIHFIRVVYSDFGNLTEQLSELASLCGLKLTLNHEFRLLVPETAGAGFRTKFAACIWITRPLSIEFGFRLIMCLWKLL